MYTHVFISGMELQSLSPIDLGSLAVTYLKNRKNMKDEYRRCTNDFYRCITNYS